MDSVAETRTVEVTEISKSFNGTCVVDAISLDVNPGEIFGLIGPNGAGKTTTIRMMMDIIKPDAGEVRILGEVPNENLKNRIGYLPEERGLYQKQSVLETLVYLATLKGLSPRVARIRADGLLDRVGMLAHRTKKVSELSRGMGQLIQFLVTIIHDPQLVILDEPFGGLDPVNTEMLKDLINELRDQGKAFILSTHRMNEVEALCDRVFMIDRGRNVLAGALKEIKSRYRSNSIVLEVDGELPHVPGITRRRDHPGHVELFFDPETSAPRILAQLIARGVNIHRFEVATPSLNDIFIHIVETQQ